MIFNGMNWIWLVALITWAMIFALSLVMLSLMRQVGQLTNYLDGVKATGEFNDKQDSVDASRPMDVAQTDPAQEAEAVEVFAPFSKLPEHTLPLLNGGTFQSGRGQTAPQLIVFLSPKSGACEPLSEAIKHFVKNNPPSETAFLVVLAMERSKAPQYIAEKLLQSLPAAVLEELPESLRPPEIPFAIAVAADGKIAARGKPKSLLHLTEMAVAARNMASMCPAHSRRMHEWGESAPYWAAGQLTDGNQQTGPVVEPSAL